MNVQIRMKSNKFRNSLRKKQLESYFYARRIDIIDHQRKKEDVQLLNQSVKQQILKGDFEGLYDLLFKDKSVQKISILDEQNTLNMYQLLSNNLSKIHSVLLLKSIIQLHYELIYLEQSRSQFNKQIVDIIYQQIFEGVNKLANQQNQQELKTTKIIINGNLNCIYFLVLNQNKKKNQFSFQESTNLSYLTQLFLYLNTLYTSPIYLIIVSISQQDYRCSQIPICKNYILAYPEIIYKLIDQVNLNSKKNIALPSLLLLNSFLHILIDSKDIIVGFVPHYLAKLKIVYSNSQTPSPYFKIFTFYDMLQNISIIFQRLSNQILNSHLGQIVSNANFWNFCALLLGIQTQQIQKELFTIIKSTINNMMINNASLYKIIPNNVVSLILQGLQSKNIEIISQNLDILRLMLRASQQTNNEQNQYVQYMYESGIKGLLQNIQSYKNTEIAQKALILRKQLDCYSNQDKMMVE